MGLFSDKRNYEKSIGQITASETPYEKSFKESFLDDWHFQTYTGNSYSKTNNLHDEYEKEIKAIEEQTGKKLNNPYYGAFTDFIVEDILRDSWAPGCSTKDKRLQKRIERYNKDLDKLKEQFPELKHRSAEEIDNDIKKQALEYYQKLNDGRDANGWGSFAGAMAGGFMDPINMFTTLISGGGGAAKQGVLKALGKTAATEFISNSAIEAIIQPSVYQYKKELEIPYSKGEAALNVAMAGVGGAVVGTTLKGVNLTAKQVLAKFKKAKAKGIDFDGKVKADAEFLEQKVALDDWLDETNPYGKDLDSRLLHEGMLEVEMKRLTDETGEFAEANKNILEELEQRVNEKLSGEPELLKGENGKPLTVYRGMYLEHGKREPYKELTWFTEDKEYAKSYKKRPEDAKLGVGVVDKAYLRMKKPLDVGSTDELIGGGSGFKDEKGVFRERTKEDAYKLLSEKTGISVKEIKKALDKVEALHDYDLVNSKEFVELAKKHGYDGLVAKEYGHKTYAIFDNEQAERLSFWKKEPKDNAVYSQINENKPLKVSDFESFDSKKLNDELLNIENLTPEEKQLNAEMLERFSKEDSWDDHILECIVEFGKR